MWYSKFWSRKEITSKIQLLSFRLDCRGSKCKGTLSSLLMYSFYVISHLSFMICHIWHKLQCSNMRYNDDKMLIYMSKICVKSSVTSQRAAPKLAKVHFDILNLKRWKRSDILFWNILCNFDKKVLYCKFLILMNIFG